MYLPKVENAENAVSATAQYLVVFLTQHSSKYGNGMDSVRQTTQNPFSMGSPSKNVSICPSSDISENTTMEYLLFKKFIVF